MTANAAAIRQDKNLIIILFFLSRRKIKMTEGYIQDGTVVCKLWIKCPLSLWERVRVRAFRENHFILPGGLPGPHPLPLSQR
jgi:hypothetical protein